MIVRHERAGDQPGVRQVVSAAFGQNEEADLVDRLREDGDVALAHIAERRGEIVGHALWSRLVGPVASLALAPVSVRPDMQRLGVGEALIRAGQSAMAGGDWELALVLGDPAYYGRFGFSAACAVGVDCDYAGPHLQAWRPAGRSRQIIGRYAYPAAFGAAE